MPAGKNKIGNRKKVPADKPIKAPVDGEVPVGHRVERGQIDDLDIAEDLARGAESETPPVEGEKSVLLFDEMEEGKIGHDAPEPQRGETGDTEEEGKGEQGRAQQ